MPIPSEHLVGIAAALVLDRGPTTPARRLVGWSLAAAGVVLAARCVRVAGRVHLAAPDDLVTAGPYAVSRNPMYLAWALLHLGVGLAAGSRWTLVTLPAACGWTHAEVLREERALTERFGTRYRTYRTTVPRYLR
ncbi:isoprenylcysteine carboxylmethyltransferase family protein [Actinophytocola sp.]|uniref:methyltransferase family protein n=1 Tax=Actinophytocola sp. TaxID=1872138 RepID=UPI002ED678CC